MESRFVDLRARACISLLQSLELHFGDYGVGCCQQTINGSCILACGTPDLSVRSA
eukprot:SAG31_NODE_5045_length_2778_cov_22.202688_3_plen_55_part_00